MRGMENKILFGNAILWVAIWLGFMLVYTFLDVVIWRKLFPAYEKYLNIASIILCITLFLQILIGKTGYRIRLLENISLVNIILAVGCAILFYLLLDKCLDPVFESLFPASEQSKKRIESVKQALQIRSKYNYNLQIFFNILIPSMKCTLDIRMQAHTD